MNKTEPTKGPWEVDAVFEDDSVDITLNYQIPGGGSPIVLASFYFDDGLPITRKEAYANAKLCVEAEKTTHQLTELMAACKEVIRSASSAWPASLETELDILELKIAKIENERTND